MGKRSGSYESIIRGVSEQIPEDRREGQHFEQVNFISDTIQGLVRRHGSVYMDEKVFSSFNPNYKQATIDDTASFKSYDFSSDEGSANRYSIFYRTDKKVTNSQAPFCFCLNRDTFKFLPVVFGNDTLFNQLSNGGASSITNMGSFLFFSGNDIIPQMEKEEVWNSKANKQKAVAWVRTASNNREYKVELHIKNSITNVVTVVEGKYKTKSSQYPGTLDTSMISASDEAYQKKVNDITNTYNNNANAWIIEAATDILPSNVAAKLILDLQDDIDTKSLTPYINLQRVDGSIGILCSGDYFVDNIFVDDDGDKTEIKGVANQVSNIDGLTALHFKNKVVRIIPENGSNLNAKYMIADIPEISSLTNIYEVGKWRETAGVKITPKNVFCYGIVNDGTLYVAGSKAELMTITGLTADQLPVDFVSSSVGDDVTVRPPNFIGKKISYLGNFQDRMVIGSESVLTFSRTGQYLDFFRQTIDTVLPTDGIEIYSLGSDGDVIKHAAFFDKNLIFFGNRKQYVIDGKVQLTPQTSNIVQLSSHEDAVDSEPKSSGNYIFYMKYRNEIASLHQFQQGLVQDSPDSYENSSQLSTYLTGKPIEILALTTPNKIIIRLDKVRNEFYLYDYLDDSGQRLFDSWSKWNWDEKLGYHVGLSYRKGNLGVITIRENGNNWFVACDNFVFDKVMTDKPILDSIRKYETLPNNGINYFLTKESNYENLALGYDDNSVRFLLGTKWNLKEQLIESYPGEDNNLWAGFINTSFVTPTNPYVRDGKDKAMTSGRLIINKFIITVDKTGGLFVDVNSFNKERTNFITKGQLLGVNSLIGTQPILNNKTLSVWVGKEVKDFTYSLKAVDWLPVTIRGIQYEGQFTLNHGRI